MLTASLIREDRHDVGYGSGLAAQLLLTVCRQQHPALRKTPPWVLLLRRFPKLILYRLAKRVHLCGARLRWVSAVII